MATDMAKRMSAVVAAVGPELRRSGFRKFRHTFNRSPETGLVHVVNFQMGPYEPPGTVTRWFTSTTARSAPEPVNSACKPRNIGFG
jgi:hypothetical protein